MTKAESTGTRQQEERIRRRAECDVVMKGGITSGLVYPMAITVLSEKFRFRRLGGTSAGAIAAALTAAAEYQRQHKGTDNGFTDLARITNSLKHRHSPAGVSGMRKLFMPQNGTRKLFDVVSAAYQKSRIPYLPVVLILLRHAPVWTVAASLGLLLYTASGLTLTVLTVIGVVRIFSHRNAKPEELTRPRERPSRTEAKPLSARVREWLWPVAVALLVILLPALTYWALLSAGVLESVVNALISFAASLVAIPDLLQKNASPRASAYILSVHEAVVWFFTLGSAGLTLLALGLVGLSLQGWRWVTKNLPDNDYGFCNGSGFKGSADPGKPDRPAADFKQRDPSAFTDWLYDSIQTVAGRTPQDSPLTFLDLWTAGRPTASVKASESPPEDAAVDLRLVTTCLSHQRPYRLPWALTDQVNLAMLHNELYAFFPEAIAAHIVQKARGVVDHDGKSYYVLPDAAHLPIVFATRLSMSFPALFSAVPMYHVRKHDDTWRLVPNGRVLFSDGGLTSNFPLALFDEPLAERLAFAFDLKYTNTTNHTTADDVQLLSDPDDTWGQPIYPTAGLPAFIGSIVESARLWSDNTQLDMPGIKDRIARICIYSGQGGLNLNMDDTAIQALLNRGEEAGRRIMHEFDPHAATTPTDRWTQHKWTRLRITLLGLEITTRRLKHMLQQRDFNLCFKYANANDPAYASPVDLKQLSGIIRHLNSFVRSIDAIVEPPDMAPLFRKHAPLPEQFLRLRPPIHNGPTKFDHL